MAIVLVSEKYESLSVAFREIAKEANELDTITYNGVSHVIEYFLGGDVKFLSLVCCIVHGANAVLENPGMWIKIGQHLTKQKEQELLMRLNILLQERDTTAQEILSLILYQLTM